MTSQYDFANDEWDLMVRAPLLAGMAVARAEDSGFLGSIREVRTLLADIESGSEKNPAANLISQAAASNHDDAYQTYKKMSADALLTDALETCRRLGPLLDSKAETTAEAVGYKQWIIATAHHVAEAAKEQGVRVSTGEQEVIDQLADALAVDQV